MLTGPRPWSPGPPSVLQEEEVARKFLFTVLDGVELVNPGSVVVGVPPEGHLQLLQEFVHPTEQRLRRVRCRLHTGASLEDDDPL